MADTTAPNTAPALPMDAYYYGFEPTGVREIDLILSAVACAGKAFHETADWRGEARPYDGHTGATPVEWIQNAANAAADEVRAALAAQQPAEPVAQGQAEADGRCVIVADRIVADADSDETAAALAAGWNSLAAAPAAQHLDATALHALAQRWDDAGVAMAARRPEAAVIRGQALRQCARELLEALAAATAAQPPALPDVIEQIACEWDGCSYDDAPGGAIDIGAAIREAGRKLAGTKTTGENHG